MRPPRRALADRRLVLRRARDAGLGAQHPRVRRGHDTWKRLRIAVDAKEMEGDERADRWQVLLRTWPSFAKYEERTDRLIPVFELTRR
ncbi:nitroreductase/quinone reductase family protein [Nocardioides sp. HB32]